MAENNTPKPNKGKKAPEQKIEKKTLLPKEVFGVKVSSDLIHQALMAARSNQRQGTAHAKDRGEARGGGAKPWRQKGTGRARHGSRRSPIWVGGGVTFGPNKERNYKKALPQKMKRKALLGMLSAKAQNNQVFIIEDIKIKEPKTKTFTKQFKESCAKVGLNFNKSKDLESTLLVLPDKREDIIKASKNLKNIKTIEAKNLNVLDIGQYKNLVLIKDSVKVIKEVFVK